MTTQLLRLYQSDQGVWRYDIERNGKVTWTSLRTKSERKARRLFEKIQQQAAAVEAFVTKRNALFRNPTLEGALAFWNEQHPMPPNDSLAPLAAVHKGRLQWLDATDEMLITSQQWLEEHGYTTSWRTAQPLTPARRDADRKRLGMLPLNPR